jgi:hypothetical protein
MARTYVRLNSNARLKGDDVRESALFSGDLVLTEYGEFFILLKRSFKYDKHVSLLHCPRRGLKMWEGSIGYFTLYREVK